MNNVTKIFELIEKEKVRQEENIQLIASENFVSPEVLQVQGSILTNKYAEGYPNRRYYGGCEYIDQLEQLAITTAQELFKTDYHVNVQPHSGTSANTGVYLSTLKPNDTILAMELNHGGHLTHGHKLSISGILYNIVGYQVTKDEELIDYDQVQKLALESKPKLIICGASAYSRTIDFKRFREIADSVGAILMADIAHIAGLIAAGLHPSPFGYADFVTTTTHKTLRGPRGGMIFCKQEYAKKLDSAVFPGIQGGPLEHVIAAKAVCFSQNLEPEFVTYQEQVIKNAKAFAKEFQKLGYRVISSTTDNHLLMLDMVSSKNITGDIVEKLLDEHNITINKNSIPYDTNPPMKPSGIRVGTPAMTTRGYLENDFVLLAQKIDTIINQYIDTTKPGN